MLGLARVGLSLWDHLFASVGFGTMNPNDRAPRVADVPVCNVAASMLLDVCVVETEQRTTLIDSALMVADLGLQHRFRPGTSWSLVFGASFGGLVGLGRARRVVNGCDSCGSLPVDLHLGGMYLAPFVRATIGDLGLLAVVFRSHWFVTGNLSHAQTLGLELGLP